MKHAFNTPVYSNKIAVAACNNEDFEASAAGNITTSNQITGWTVDEGSNTNGNNSCNLLGCCPNPGCCPTFRPTDNNPIPAIAGPIVSGSRGPWRSTNPPAHRDNAASKIIKGNCVSPAAAA